MLRIFYALPFANMRQTLSALSYSRYRFMHHDRHSLKSCSPLFSYLSSAPSRERHGCPSCLTFITAGHQTVIVHCRRLAPSLPASKYKDSSCPHDSTLQLLFKTSISTTTTTRYRELRSDQVTVQDGYLVRPRDRHGRHPPTRAIQYQEVG